jgi:hypothetical protein
MEIAAVDERDLNGRMLQRFRGIEPAEAAAEDDDALCDTFRIAAGPARALFADALSAPIRRGESGLPSLALGIVPAIP